MGWAEVGTRGAGKILINRSDIKKKSFNFWEKRGDDFGLAGSSPGCARYVSSWSRGGWQETNELSRRGDAW